MFQVKCLKAGLSVKQLHAVLRQRKMHTSAFERQPLCYKQNQFIRYKKSAVEKELTINCITTSNGERKKTADNVEKERTRDRNLTNEGSTLYSCTQGKRVYSSSTSLVKKYYGLHVNIDCSVNDRSEITIKYMTCI